MLSAAAVARQSEKQEIIFRKISASEEMGCNQSKPEDIIELESARLRIEALLKEKQNAEKIGMHMIYFDFVN